MQPCFSPLVQVHVTKLVPELFFNPKKPPLKSEHKQLAYFLIKHNKQHIF